MKKNKITGLLLAFCLILTACNGQQVEDDSLESDSSTSEENESMSSSSSDDEDDSTISSYTLSFEFTRDGESTTLAKWEAAYIIGSWDDFNSFLPLTKSGNTYSYTFKDIEIGNYEYLAIACYRDKEPSFDECIYLVGDELTYSTLTISKGDSSKLVSVELIVDELQEVEETYKVVSESVADALCFMYYHGYSAGAADNWSGISVDYSDIHRLYLNDYLITDTDYTYDCIMTTRAATNEKYNYLYELTYTYYDGSSENYYGEYYDGRYWYDNLFNLIIDKILDGTPKLSNQLYYLTWMEYYAYYWYWDIYYPISSNPEAYPNYTLSAYVQRSNYGNYKVYVKVNGDWDNYDHFGDGLYLINEHDEEYMYATYDEEFYLYEWDYYYSFDNVNTFVGGEYDDLTIPEFNLKTTQVNKIQVLPYEGEVEEPEWTSRAF